MLFTCTKSDTLESYINWTLGPAELGETIFHKKMECEGRNKVRLEKKLVPIHFLNEHTYAHVSKLTALNIIMKVTGTFSVKCSESNNLDNEF